MRVIFFDIDTLRPDHLGCYGYNRDTSPCIDSIAAEGIRFTNYYCTDAPCLPSRAALLSGRYGINSGAVSHGGSNAAYFNEGESRGFKSRFAQSCLTSIFRNAGMKTATISSFAERHSFFDFYAGFNEAYNVGKSGLETAEEVADLAVEWIERNKGNDNWYLHVNMWDAHTPYRTPAGFNPFENQPLKTFLTDEKIAAHNRQASPHGSLEINMFDDKIDEKYPKQPGRVENMNDYKKLVDGYDGGIRYLDSQISKIIELLKSQGVYEDVNIIISADHGENLGELNIYSEHATADNITCNIPMIIKWQGCKKGIVEENIWEHIDLLPTLAELMNMYVRPIWDGKSYAPVLKGEKKVRNNYAVLSQLAHTCQRAVRFEDFIYIKTYHDGYHLFDEEMLFNIKADRHEENNVIDKHPEKAEYARKILNDFTKRNLEKSGHGDPMETVLKEGIYHIKGKLKYYVDYLRKTGREEAADNLEKKHLKS